MAALEKLIETFGYEEALHQLALQSGYEQRVPTIDDFMRDPFYLGKSLVKENGELAVWPCWEKELKEIFPNPYHITHAEIYATGGIGIGKSTFSKIAVAYCICKMLCLKSPHSYYDLLPTTIIKFALLNATMGLSFTVLYQELIELFENSPFFKSKFNPNKDTLFVNKIDLGFGSTGKHFLGMCVPMAVFSEINDATRAGQGQEMFTTIYQRLKSRFANKGKPLPGFIILDSSNKGNKSFVDTRIEEKTNNGDTDWKLIRLAGWEARWHFGGYSGKFFKVFAGDANKDPFIIEEDTDPRLVASLDQARIVDVPVEHEQEFRLNVIEALRDMAGVSTFGTWSFLSSREILNKAACHINPITKHEIVLDFFDKEDKLMSYIDVKKMAFINNKFRFIHVDLGLKNDSTGIACSYLKGFTTIERYDPVTGDKTIIRVPVIDTEWAMEIKCKPGQEVPIYKIKDFLIEATQLGYPIKMVTTDGYQSTNLRQDLLLAGIKTALQSVDRTKDPYNYMRNGILEGRITLPNLPKLLTELFELEEGDKKFDHPVDGSKDIADAVCGSIWSVSEDINETGGMQTPQDLSDVLDAFNNQNDFKSTLISMVK